MSSELEDTRPASHPDSTSRGRLLRLFDGGSALTYEQIGERLGVGERQARRLLQRLRSDGVPVEEARVGKTKAFSIPEQHRRATIGPIAFTEEESLALAVAAGAAEAVLGAMPLATPARRAFGRILVRLRPRLAHVDLGEQPARWYVRATAQTRCDPDVFATLVTGLNEQRSLRIDYGKEGAAADTRKVDPLCIAVLERAVLLTAWSHRDGDYRHFSLARIRHAALCDPAAETRPYFDRPDDFDPERFYRPDDHGALTAGELETFRILVEPEVAHLFREREYRDLQLIEEERPDGRLVVSYEGRGFEEWRSFFQSWGAKVTVLDPPSMRERLRADAEEVARRYGTASPDV